MKKFSNQLSYEITEDGYDIYLDGVKWICQHEPYIPDPTLTYEENDEAYASSVEFTFQDGVLTKFDMENYN